MDRKPIQMMLDNSQKLIALCDDGTMWYLNRIEYMEFNIPKAKFEWIMIPSIPQK